MANITGLQLAENLSDYVNTFSSKEREKEFIDGFCRQHRTLQQSSLRLILALIEHISSDEYHVDGRNEASKKTAKMLLEGFKYKQLIAEGVSPTDALTHTGQTFLPSQFLPFI